MNEAKVVNDVDAALGGTRVLRLALNVLYDGMEELCRYPRPHARAENVNG